MCVKPSKFEIAGLSPGVTSFYFAFSISVFRPADDILILLFTPAMLEADRSVCLYHSDCTEQLSHSDLYLCGNCAFVELRLSERMIHPWFNRARSMSPRCFKTDPISDRIEGNPPTSDDTLFLTQAVYCLTGQTKPLPTSGAGLFGPAIFSCLFRFRDILPPQSRQSLLDKRILYRYHCQAVWRCKYSSVRNMLSNL